MCSAPPPPPPSFPHSSFAMQLPLRFLMLLGSFAAILHGAALPALVFIFGVVLTDFSNHFISPRFTILTGGILNCSASNFSITVLRTSRCTLNIAPGTTYEDVLERCLGGQRECLTTDEFLQRIDTQVYIFLGLAAGVFIAGTLQIMSYQLAAERQVYKIRLLFYRAILRQNIGWFDINPSVDISSILIE